MFCYMSALCRIKSARLYTFCYNQLDLFDIICICLLKVRACSYSSQIRLALFFLFCFVVFYEIHQINLLKETCLHVLCSSWIFNSGLTEHYTVNC